jgi:hypothetical protein
MHAGSPAGTCALYSCCGEDHILGRFKFFAHTDRLGSHLEAQPQLPEEIKRWEYPEKREFYR